MANLYDKASLVLPTSPAYKDGAIQAYKPLTSQGTFDFTRGSNLAATRVDANGLIEKGRENEALYSNTFNNWVDTSISLTANQSGYDNSSDAWLIESTATNAAAYINRNHTHSGVFTISVYAKKGTSNWMALATTGSHFAHFDLENGVVGIATGPNIIDHTIQSVGNGWYRCSMTSRGYSNYYVFIANGDNDRNTNSGDNIYIQDFQLEAGLVATDYIETGASTAQAGILEDMPRLDYSGGADCPALLLEPQRTNVNAHSEYFDSWLKNGSGTITNNYGTSPEGVQNALRYQAPSGSRYVVYRTISVSNATTYTLSLYAKSLSGTQKIRIGADNGCANPQGAETFDVGTEWTRVETQITSTTTSWNIFFDNIESGITCTGTYLSADLLVYGFQLEAGNYSTSYIPTYGSSVTRSGDSCSKTGISGLIGQTEGTLFFECSNKALVNQARYFILSDGGFNNRIDIYQFSDTQLGVYVAAGGSAQVAGQYVTLPSSGSFKFALAYANNDYVWYLNGSQIGTDTTGSVPSLDTALFALDAAGNIFGGAGNSPFKQALLFKTRLTNAELASLTTL